MTREGCEGREKQLTRKPVRVTESPTSVIVVVIPSL